MELGPRLKATGKLKQRTASGGAAWTKAKRRSGPRRRKDELRWKQGAARVRVSTEGKQKRESKRVELEFGGCGSSKRWRNELGWSSESRGGWGFGQGRRRAELGYQLGLQRGERSRVSSSDLGSWWRAIENGGGGGSTGVRNGGSSGVAEGRWWCSSVDRGRGGGGKKWFTSPEPPSRRTGGGGWLCRSAPQKKEDEDEEGEDVGRGAIFYGALFGNSTGTVSKQYQGRPENFINFRVGPARAFLTALRPTSLPPLLLIGRKQSPPRYISVFLLPPAKQRSAPHRAMAIQDQPLVPFADDKPRRGYLLGL